MERLLELLEGINENVDFENCKSLIDDGFLDSFDIVSIVVALNEEYSIQITPEYIIPDNFNSVESIFNMIKKLQNN